MSNQLKLINHTKIFEHHSFVESYLKIQEPDCILYSMEGTQFNIHKEILYLTRFMMKILQSANETCCKKVEIFCPCSENELETIVNFLYNGVVSYDLKDDVTEFTNKLAETFGFSEDLFSVENIKKPKPVRIKFEKKYESNHDLKTKPLSSNDIQNLTETDPLIISFNPMNSNSTVAAFNSDPIENGEAEIIPFNPENSDMEHIDFISNFSDDGTVISNESASNDTKFDFKKPHACKICDSRFSTKTHLRNHTLSIHEKKKPYKCSSCHYRSSFKVEPVIKLSSSEVTYLTWKANKILYFRSKCKSDLEFQTLLVVKNVVMR